MSSLLALCAVFLLSLLPMICVAQQAKGVNVLFIAVDDLNCAPACYRNPVVQTPNIDKLATRGVLFERAYCQYPLCNPSRSSILTGFRPDTLRIFNNQTPPLTYATNAVFLPDLLRKNGYFTGRVGKILHGTYEKSVTWDASTGGSHAVGDDDSERGGAGSSLRWGVSTNADETESDGITARRAADLIAGHAGKGGKPFFIAVGFLRPHLPFVAPKKYFDLYPPDRIRLPEEPSDIRRQAPGIALHGGFGTTRMTDREKKEIIAAYYACVSFLDAQVGVLMDALDRHGLWDNTVVILWSDHGYLLGEHGGLWRKGGLFEEVARVPLIIAAPGRAHGEASPRVVELVDLYPTVLELCRLPVPGGLGGASLVPLLDDPRRPWERPAFTMVERPGRNPVLARSVRTERFRYTQWRDEDEAELYDHDSDPGEHRNLIRDPKYADSVRRMRALLKDGPPPAEPPSVRNGPGPATGKMRTRP